MPRERGGWRHSTNQPGPGTGPGTWHPEGAAGTPEPRTAGTNPGVPAEVTAGQAARHRQVTGHPSTARPRTVDEEPKAGRPVAVMPEERAQAESPPTAADDAADGRLEALFSPSDQADADGLDQLHQPAAAEPGTDEGEPAQKGGSAIGQPSGSQPTTLPPPSGSSDGGGKAKQRGWISLAVPRHRRGMTRRESAHFWRISRQRHNTFAHTRCPLVTRGAGSSIRWPGYGHRPSGRG